MRYENTTEEIDRAVAMFLVTPSSRTALDICRAARRFRVDHDGKEADDLYSDSKGLFGSALIMESDPEIVKRNTLARVLAGISPVLNTWEEMRSLEDRTAREIGMDLLGIASEVSSATQYLESTRLNADLHFKEQLFSIEERMVDIAPGSNSENVEKAVIEFIDSIRDGITDPKQKPVIVFSLRTILCVMSYEILKENTLSTEK